MVRSGHLAPGEPARHHEEVFRRRSADAEITRQEVSDVIMKLMVMDSKLNLILELLNGGEGEEED